MENVFVQIWTFENVCDFLGCRRSHVYKLMRIDPDFPKPIRFGTCVRFCADDFARYVDNKRVKASSEVAV